MWLFTVFGYYSIIQHNKDPELLLVRSRVKGDLEKLKGKYLKNLGDIVETPIGADYPYRALAWKSELASAMKQVFLDIDYTNFKSEVAKKQDWPRHDLYMKVWGIMKMAESTLRSLERAEKERSHQQTIFSNGHFWDDGESSSSGKFGGKGKLYTDLPDRRDAIKARNERLARGSKKLRAELREVKSEEELARQRDVEKLVKKSLKGTSVDFDKEFEDESNPFEVPYGLDPEDLSNLSVEPEDVGLVDDDNDE